MAEGIQFVKNVGDIPIYNDIYMEHDSYLVMRKGEEYSGPGIIWVPEENWNQGMKTVKGAPITEEEINESLKRKKITKLSEIKAIICNVHSPDVIEKIIESLYKNFK